MDSLEYKSNGGSPPEYSIRFCEDGRKSGEWVANNRVGGSAESIWQPLKGVGFFCSDFPSLCDAYGAFLSFRPRLCGCISLFLRCMNAPCYPPTRYFDKRTHMAVSSLQAPLSVYPHLPSPVTGALTTRNIRCLLDVKDNLWHDYTAYRASLRGRVFNQSILKS